MDDLEMVYDEAYNENIEIINMHFSETKKAACVCNRTNNILLDKAHITSSAEEKEKLGREVMHIKTGNLFYIQGNKYLLPSYKKSLEVRTKHAYIRKTLPPDKLQQAIDAHCLSIGEIAEYFDHTPEFVKETFEYYEGVGLEFVWPEQDWL